MIQLTQQQIPVWHQVELNLLTEKLAEIGQDSRQIIEKIKNFSVAVPSWALGTGGTRFGRFAGGGEPQNIEQKLEDAALLRQLTGACRTISLHIPWDIPQDHQALVTFAQSLGIGFDAVNSNTFQDQANAQHSYKFGSLCHTDTAVRKQAVAHNIEVIKHGKALGSTSLTVWLADGSDFPGQHNFRKAFSNTLESLQAIYEEIPENWKLLVEYKPYEPHFYSMVIPDWGTSFLLCQKLGDRAKVLVDLGHHLPNTNIEQIVARLAAENKLGGFHFNGSMYGDDDLTVGATKPYQLFLIFAELLDSTEVTDTFFERIDFMIDASHNIKDPLEDLIQSLQNLKMTYAKALLINRTELEKARENNDAALAQEILNAAFFTDVSPLLRQAAIETNRPISPLQCYRDSKVRELLIAQRGKTAKASGL